MTGNLNILRKTEYDCEVDWRIENFLSLSKGDFDTYRSPSFTWSTLDWWLQMSFSSETDIRLVLYKGSSEGCKVEFKLGIRLLDGTSEMRCNLIKQFRHSVFKEWSGTDEFILYSELIERKHELLPDEILTVSCLILADPNTLIKPSIIKYERSQKSISDALSCKNGHELNQISIQTYPSNPSKLLCTADVEVLSSNLKALYDCSKCTDMTIIVENQSYPVHKDILAARSDVFAAMFQHKMEKTNSGIIKIADCEPNSFKDFLLYIYTGKVENFSSKNVCHLYKAADKFNVQELKALCVTYMERNISTTNLFDIFTLANEFNEAELISLTQEFFNRNTLRIIRGDDWKDLMEQNFYVANQLFINKVEKTEAEN